MTDYRVAYVLDDDGEPVAVFLDSGPDCNPGYLMTYVRVGEHCEASTGWVREQSLASDTEYRDLHTYLSRRYADPAQGDPVTLVVDQQGLAR